MTKVFCVIIAGLVLIGCSSSNHFMKSDSGLKKVALFAEDIVITDSRYFSEEAVNMIYEDNLAHELGNDLLQSIFKGFYNQMEGIEIVTDTTNADVIIEAKAVRTKHKRLTLNLPKPGPILKIEVDVEFRDGNQRTEKSYSTKINMAEVNFPESNVKWMSKVEKENPELQKITFERGLRKLYQDMYFNYFDISLRL